MNRDPNRVGPIDRLAAIASVVFIADFATKQWALHQLSGSKATPGSGWQLAVVNNTHLGWGLGSARSALPLTLALTLTIVALVLQICRPLTEIDPGAPTMLGLLVGSGAANLADALIPPHGVVDFIAFTPANGTTTSFNIADVMLAIGLALSLRAMWRIVLRIRGRAPTWPHLRTSSRTEAFAMRDRVLLSSGHALLAMCAFIWLYSMVLPWLPEQGRSAPNSLLCGVGVFAVTFMISRARSRLIDRHASVVDEVLRGRPIERLVLDSSVPAFARSDERRSPRSDDAPRAPIRDSHEQPRADEPPVA